MKKILFTGGHHTPAVSVIQEIKRRELDVEIYWVGHKYTMVNDTSESAEFREITALGIDFFELKTAKLYRQVTLINVFKVLVGAFNSAKILFKIRPDIVVSFGGYLAVPVVVVAKLFRIPVITHEQTSTTGLANRVIARFADKILLTWPTSSKFYTKYKNKTEVVGLPIRKNIYSSEKFDNLNQHLQTIYITGGKQGSNTFNVAVETILDQLLDKYNVIHQVGNNSVYKDYERLSEFDSSEKNGSYILREFFSFDEIGIVFNSSDFVISRGGANTLYELLLLSKPAIIIPIPWASHNEQYENAKYLEDNGAGIILEQDKLTGKSLFQAVELVSSGYNNYKESVTKLKNNLIKDADIKITNIITNLLQI